MRLGAEVERLSVETGRLRGRCGNLRWSPFGRDGGIGRRGGLKIRISTSAGVREALGTYDGHEIKHTGHFDLDGVHSLADLARVLEVAITDTLALPNSISRSRTLAQLIQTGLRLYLPEPPLIQLPDRTPGHTLADTPPHLSLLPACPTADHPGDVRPHRAPPDPSLPATPDPAAEGGP